MKLFGYCIQLLLVYPNFGNALPLDGSYFCYQKCGLTPSTTETVQFSAEDLNAVQSGLDTYCSWKGMSLQGKPECKFNSYAGVNNSEMWKRCISGIGDNNKCDVTTFGICKQDNGVVRQGTFRYYSNSFAFKSFSDGEHLTKDQCNNMLGKSGCVEVRCEVSSHNAYPFQVTNKINSPYKIE